MSEMNQEEIHITAEPIIPSLLIYQSNTLTPRVAEAPVSTLASVESIIAKYDWDDRLAIAIFKGESGLNPTAVNRKDNHRVCMGSYGIAQLGCVHFGNYGLTKYNWDEPAANIRAAYLLYQERGWRPWAVFTTGRFRRYLTNH